MVGSGRKQPWPISEQERALVGVLVQQTSSRDIAARASGRHMLKVHGPAVGRRKLQVGGASVSYLIFSYTPPVGPQGITKTHFLLCSPRLSPSSCEPFSFFQLHLSLILFLPRLFLIYLPSSSFLFILLPFITFFSSSTTCSRILPLFPPCTSQYIRVYTRKHCEGPKNTDVEILTDLHVLSLLEYEEVVFGMLSLYMYVCMH
jgi:hypothetical protein